MGMYVLSPKIGPRLLKVFFGSNQEEMHSSMKARVGRIAYAVYPWIREFVGSRKCRTEIEIWCVIHPWCSNSVVRENPVPVGV